MYATCIARQHPITKTATIIATPMTIFMRSSWPLGIAADQYDTSCNLCTPIGGVIEPGASGRERI
jgi:hypothetical protein